MIMIMSTTRVLAATVAGCLVFAPMALADDTRTPLEQYRAESLSLGSAAWKGVVLRRGAKRIELGFFGGDGEEIFDGSPKALEEMATYRTLRITGFTMWVAGLATLVSELVILLVDEELLIEPAVFGSPSGPKPLFYGLLIGGTVVGVAGGAMMGAANWFLSDAVDHYNADLYQRLRRVRADMGGTLSLRWSGRF